MDIRDADEENEGETMSDWNVMWVSPDEAIRMYVTHAERLPLIRALLTDEERADLAVCLLGMNTPRVRATLRGLLGDE